MLDIDGRVLTDANVSFGRDAIPTVFAAAGRGQLFRSFHDRAAPEVADLLARPSRPSKDQRLFADRAKREIAIDRRILGAVDTASVVRAFLLVRYLRQY